MAIACLQRYNPPSFFSFAKENKRYFLGKRPPSSLIPWRVHSLLTRARGEAFVGCLPAVCSAGDGAARHKGFTAKQGIIGWDEDSFPTSRPYYALGILLCLESIAIAKALGEPPIQSLDGRIRQQDAAVEHGNL